jgi:predicted secreted hydrolase
MNKKLTIKIGILILLVIIIVGLIFYFNNKDKVFLFIYKNIPITSKTIDGIKFPNDEADWEKKDIEWNYLAGILNDKKNPERKFGIMMKFDHNGKGPQIFVSDINKQEKYFASTSDDIKSISSSRLFLMSGKNYWATKSIFTYKIKWETEKIAVDFDLKAIKKPIIAANEVYHLYRVQPRVEIDGSLVINGEVYNIRGTGWIDHEGFVRIAFDFVSEWRWTAVQLNTGEELMFGKIFFTRDGSPESSEYMFLYEKDSSGSNYKKIEKGKYKLEEVDWWTSPEFGTTYPVSFKLSIPSENTFLKIDSLMKDSIFRNSPGFYSSTCNVSGQFRGIDVNGWAQFENIKINLLK